MSFSSSVVQGLVKAPNALSLHEIFTCTTLALAMPYERKETPGSEYGGLIARNMEAGRIGPMEITVTLLERALRAAFSKHSVKVFLIDGSVDSFLHVGALSRFRFTLGI